MAKKAMAKAKGRNPQDTTLRNARAASRRNAELSEQIGSLSTVLQDLQRRVEALEARIGINGPA